MDYQTIRANQEKRDEIKRFVLSVMSDLYPKGAYYENPYDLEHFEQVYVQPDNACFFIAINSEGDLIGTASVRPYDRRFKEVDRVIGAGPVCEMSRFYMHPDYRRLGIGRCLYDQAEHFAKEAGYAESYLHTSLFLPGGYPFWTTRGYRERYWESEQVVHMSKRLDVLEPAVIRQKSV